MFSICFYLLSENIPDDLIGSDAQGNLSNPANENDGKDLNESSNAEAIEYAEINKYLQQDVQTGWYYSLL